MIIAICTVANYELEHDYIEEFVHYYFDVLCVDYIYLYEDICNSKQHFTSIAYIKNLIESNKIIYKLNNTRNLNEIYKLFYKEYGNNFDWCGIFDIDEFLILKLHNTIKELMSDTKLKLYEDSDCILITWKNYGINGHIFKPQSGGVLDNYYDLNNILKYELTYDKVLVRGGMNVDNLSFYINHCIIDNDMYWRVKYIDGRQNISKDKYVNRLYDKGLGLFEQTEINYDIAEIAHFRSKSVEEFVLRKRYGRIDVPLTTPRCTLQGFIWECPFFFQPYSDEEMKPYITLLVIKHYKLMFLSVYIESTLKLNYDSILRYYKNHVRFDRVYIRTNEYIETDYIKRLIDDNYVFILSKDNSSTFLENILDLYNTNKGYFDLCLITKYDLILNINCDIHKLIPLYDYETNEIILIDNNYMMTGFKGILLYADNEIIDTPSTNNKLKYEGNDAYMMYGWSELKSLLLKKYE